MLEKIKECIRYRSYAFLFQRLQKVSLAYEESKNKYDKACIKNHTDSVGKMEVDRMLEEF